MFLKFILLVFCMIWIYDIVDNIQLPRRQQKRMEPKEPDLFQHPLLVEYGIERPLEEVELEEVEFVPLQWQVKYNERINDFATVEIKESILIEQ